MPGTLFHLKLTGHNLEETIASSLFVAFLFIGQNDILPRLLSMQRLTTLAPLGTLMVSVPLAEGKTVTKVLLDKSFIVFTDCTD